MRLADIVGGPWAITPEMFSEVQGIYARHMRGEKLSVKDVEARIGAPVQTSRAGYTIENGVAVIPIEGVLAKKMNLFTQISGGASTQVIDQQIRSAVADPLVKSIVLLVDSPGGTVDGTQALADTVFASRGSKPIIALADGMMSSAAYWIGSAADRVFIAGDTTAVGSIGVVATHVDISRYEEKQGLKTTEITAGKYKRISSEHAPLSDEGKSDIQAKVDYLYSVFVKDVARNRGVNEEKVLQDMADGRVFMGQQAVKSGLVDGVSTLGDVITNAAAGEFSVAALSTKKLQVAATGAGVASTANVNSEERMMEISIETIKGQYPEVANALINEGHAAGVAAGFKEGAATELARIQAVENQALPGHDALIKELKYDGKTTGAEAAVAVLSAERAKRTDRLTALQNDAAAAAKTPSALAPTDPAPEATTDKPVNAHAVARAAQDYQREEAAKGNRVGAAEAVAHVTTLAQAK